MKLKVEDIRTFPKFHYYVRVELPKVSEATAIVAKIKKFSGKTTKNTIKRALEWGNGPTIEIVENLQCAGVMSYGCYAWGGDVLQVDKDLVEDFESGKGVVKNARGKRVFLVGATLLHELTHWADAKDGVDDAVPGDPSNEEGNAFEKAVYGKVLG